MKSKPVSSNGRIAWLFVFAVFCVLATVCTDSAFGAGSVQIKVPNGQRYQNNGNTITTAFKVCETVKANYVIMDCLDDSTNDAGTETFEVAITTDSAGTIVLTSVQIARDFGCTPGNCDEHTYLFDFSDVTLTKGVTYYLRTKVIAGAPVRFWGRVSLYFDGGFPHERRANIPIQNGFVYQNNGSIHLAAFKFSREAKGLYLIMDCLDDSTNDAGSETFEVSILDGLWLTLKARVQVTANFGCTPGNCDKHRYLFDFGNVTLKKNRLYFLKTKVISGAPVRFWGGTKLYYWPSSNYEKKANSPDVDKSDHNHVGKDTCWQATAANMLAGAGYGDGASLQARADDIYKEMVAHFGTGSGWIDSALRWWLKSTNNKWSANPYDEVTVYGNKSPKNPWANSNGARYIGNQLRRCNYVGVSISKPTADPNIGEGGHAITCWGDSSGGANMSSNPSRIRVSDSDKDSGGDIQTYTYDSYTNPNPGGSNEGNGWYFDYSTSKHWYIKHITTLLPVTNCTSGSTRSSESQRVSGSYKIHQDNSFTDANDLHYKVGTYADIQSYDTKINWDTNNLPVITPEDVCPPWEIAVDWDLSDNPIPYCTWVTITTDFTLEDKSAIYYSDVHFTYPTGIQPIPGFGWDIHTPSLLGDPNMKDISGGYVIGRFDVINPSAPGGPTVVGEYSFVHDYSFDQDPEWHNFTLQGDPNMTGFYQVQNIRFGHSYGFLEPNELWAFDSWMSDFPGPYPLEDYSELNLELNWEGQLPYPEGEYYLEIMDPPECTDYLDEDLNCDCQVDFKDYTVFTQALDLYNYEDLLVFVQSWLDDTLSGIGHRVGHWPFEAGQGTIAVDTGIGENDCTLISDANWVLDDPNRGICLDLDGSGSYAKTADSTTGLNFAPNSFSISAWINPRVVTGGWRTIAEYDRFDVSSGTNWFGIWLSDTGNFHFRVGMDTQDSNQVLIADEWYLLTATYESSTGEMKLYIDGQYDSTGTYSSSKFTSGANAKLTIGTRGTEDGEYFDGMIDDLRIYDLLLSAEDIQALYDDR